MSSNDIYIRNKTSSHQVL